MALRGMVLLAALLGLVSVSATRLSGEDLLNLALAQPAKAFSLWSQQHNAGYREGSPEFQRRLEVFTQNAKTIDAQNARNTGTTLALNEFADQTWEEFASKRLGLKITREQVERKARLSEASWRYAGAEVPRAVDWRAKGAVAEVKNQGQCGSCWAFSTTGAIEGINALVTGELVSVSEQQLVDCDTASNEGCGGGLMDDAFKYVIANGGLDTEGDYGYWSGYGFGFWCNKRKQTDRPAVSIDGYEDVPQGEASLLKAVSNQPIAVAICADSNMQFYSRGVISSCCEGLNHGVLAVGFNTTVSVGGGGGEAAHWIVKNSWGAGWGEEGFFRLKMGEGPTGLCEIASAASYPTKSIPNKPVPELCDPFGWTECPVGNACSCSFSLFGFLCLWHDCCPLAGGVTCPDLRHCCPHGTTCDQRQGACVTADGATSTPWTDKTKATSVAAPGKPLPKQQHEQVEAQVQREHLPKQQQQQVFSVGGDAKAGGRHQQILCAQ